LHPFGSSLWFRNHTETNKLAPRYIEGKLIGYVPGTINYTVLDNNGRITQSRDIVFDKSPPIPPNVDEGENITATDKDTSTTETEIIVLKPTKDEDPPTPVEAPLLSSPIAAPRRLMPDSEMIFYGVLDILAKPVFCFYHLFAMSKLDLTALQLQSGKFSSSAVGTGVSEKSRRFLDAENHAATSGVPPSDTTVVPS
jgi:hypothetical protein